MVERLHLRGNTARTVGNAAAVEDRSRSPRFRANPPLLPIPSGATPTLALYGTPGFARLPKIVQDATRGLLAVAPKMEAKLGALLVSPSFLALTPGEQRALLSPPRPERVPHAERLLGHALFPLLVGDKTGLFSASLPTQRAVIAQLERFLVKPAAELLLQGVTTPWFQALGAKDQLRAVKVLAYLGAARVGADADGGALSQKAILARTAQALLDGRVQLAFADLPAGEDQAIGGVRELPDRVHLNRHLISADLFPIGEGPLGEIEMHVGITTVAHEVDHVLRAVPEGPTYAAFMDEYQAWFTGLVAQRGTPPNLIEGLWWCQELLSNPAYPDLQAAARSGGEEAKKIFRFLSAFGRVDSIEAALSLQLDNYVALAPRPEAQD